MCGQAEPLSAPSQLASVAASECVRREWLLRDDPRRKTGDESGKPTYPLEGAAVPGGSMDQRPRRGKVREWIS
jgi:hypothetical protein